MRTTEHRNFSPSPLYLVFYVELNPLKPTVAIWVQL